MKVTLLAHTPDAEKTVATAAKLCYSASGIENIADGLDAEATEKFITMLSSLGHESPIEHISFTFGIEGVSRALTHQLVRHRIASYSQKSQRYVSENAFEYITPPAIAEDEKSNALFDETMDMIQQCYEKISSALTDKYINDGMDKKSATKKAAEDARFVLPNACETKIVVTMNARSLMNFFHHRCCERAQWEIRALADEMLRLVKEVAPSIFKYAGPSCVKGACPEGKMSCGKAVEKRREYLCL